MPQTSRTRLTRLRDVVLLTATSSLGSIGLLLLMLRLFSNVANLVDAALRGHALAVGLGSLGAAALAGTAYALLPPPPCRSPEDRRIPRAEG